jgi:hypothetical protein
VYSNPNGEQILIVAESNKGFVWLLQDGVPPQTVRVDISVATGPVWFAQAFDKVLLLRPNVTPLVWDGLNFTSGFIRITKLDPADTSTNLIPDVGYGISFQNRMIYQYGKDSVIISDLNDYTSYDNVYGLIRINSGQADQIVSIHPYNNESVLIFMTRSIHRLFNFTVDLTLAAQDQVTGKLGCVAREGAVQTGADIVFLSHAGIYRVNQVFENQTIAAPIPISDPISPILEGVNWDQIGFQGLTSMATLNDYLYCAIPIGHNYAKYILVYNLVTSEWESIDAWEDENLVFRELRVTLFNGERRLFGIDHLNQYNGPFVYLLYEGITDQTNSPAIGSTYPVNDIIETRGYGQSFDRFKRFKRASISVRTRNPSFNVSALTDGYNEVKLLTPTPITKDPSKFYVWGHKNFATGDDPNEPKRQDYYTGSETTWVAQDMSNLLPGNIDLLPAVDSEDLGGPTTESIERRLIRRRGRWCSIRIENERGACDVLGVSVDYDDTRSDNLTLA